MTKFLTDRVQVISENKRVQVDPYDPSDAAGSIDNVVIQKCTDGDEQAVTLITETDDGETSITVTIDDLLSAIIYLQT